MRKQQKIIFLQQSAAKNVAQAEATKKFVEQQKQQKKEQEPTMKQEKQTTTTQQETIKAEKVRTFTLNTGEYESDLKARFSQDTYGFNYILHPIGDTGEHTRRYYLNEKDDYQLFIQTSGKDIFPSSGRVVRKLGKFVGKAVGGFIKLGETLDPDFKVREAFQEGVKEVSGEISDRNKAFAEAKESPEKLAAALNLQHHSSRAARRAAAKKAKSEKKSDSSKTSTTQATA